MSQHFSYIFYLLTAYMVEFENTDIGVAAISAGMTLQISHEFLLVFSIRTKITTHCSVYIYLGIIEVMESISFFQTLSTPSLSYPFSYIFPGKIIQIQVTITTWAM